MALRIRNILDRALATKVQTLEATIARMVATSAPTPTITGISKIATGTVKVPGLLLGANTDVTIPLTRNMGDGYTAELLPSPTLIGGATLSVKGRAPTAVTVTVTAGIALAAGSTISIIAYA